MIRTLITVWRIREAWAWPAAVVCANSGAWPPPKKNLSTILLGHKLNVCFAATLLCAGQFRDLIQCARATNVLKIDLYFSNEIQLGFHTKENNTVLRLLVTSLSRQVSRLHIETKRLSWLKHWLLTWKHSYTLVVLSQLSDILYYASSHFRLLQFTNCKDSRQSDWLSWKVNKYQSAKYIINTSFCKTLICSCRQLQKKGGIFLPSLSRFCPRPTSVI